MKTLKKVLLSVVRIAVLLVLLGVPSWVGFSLHTQVQELKLTVAEQNDKLAKQDQRFTEWRDAVIAEYRTTQANLMMLQGR